ncbi:hypothetical protein [Pseudomonas luteola]|uniref:hypothetical protein n=1 Tax=Pseudomonas luteola TaxID=47886 RepID=UPI001AD6BF15|nr:hypothetical protein [Pseudomonas luteola]
MARAAINIIGSTGQLYDVTSQGATDITSERISAGVYQVRGTQGMVPMPPADVGWGYVLNQMDLGTNVDISYEEGVLAVICTMDGKPYDLQHMVTLHVLVDDLPVTAPEIPAETPAPSLDELKAMRKVELNQDYSAAMARLQIGWPTYEILTWPTQAEEAKAWNAAPDDAKPATPFLTALYETRSGLGLDESFADLIGRVTANDKGYTAAVATLTGIRHVAEKNIEASDDPASVSWSFP